MHKPSMWVEVLHALTGRTAARRRALSSTRSLEDLEPRIVLFAATGNAWPSPQVVTLSFQQDGTNLGGVGSNLNSSFNSNAALNGKWQNEILRAAQVWSQYTNINFVVVDDNGSASGTGDYQQGDSAKGDIRIGGYNFGNSSLARAYAPPPVNNFSIAGDIVFNTGIKFGVGSGYDLFTVAAHEIGHALGLDHTSSDSRSVLWSAYNGVKTGLSADDVAGIRNIYSGNAARAVDAYDVSGNNSFASAADVSSKLSSSQLSAVVTGLDITSTSDVDYFKITAPAGSSSTLRVAVQSSGLSLLSPKLTIYAANQTTVLGTATATTNGATLNIQVTGVAPGQTFYIKVQGANTTPFGVGQYVLVVNLGTGANPSVPLPQTMLENGDVFSGGGGVAERNASNDEFLDEVPVIDALAEDTGASSADRVTRQANVVLLGEAPEGYTVEFFRDGVSLGVVTSGTGRDTNSWAFHAGRLPDGRHTFTALGRDTRGQITGRSESFTVTVDTKAPAAATVAGFRPGLSMLGSGGTDSLASNVTGTAEVNSTVTLYMDGGKVGTALADGAGNWSIDVLVLPGPHRFTASATDLAGNISATSAPLNVVMNSLLPDAATSLLSTVTSLPVVNAVAGSVAGLLGGLLGKSNGPVLSGTGAAGSLVTIYDGAKILGTTSVAADGTWSFKSPTLGKGEHNLSVSLKESSGLIWMWTDLLTQLIA